MACILSLWALRLLLCVDSTSVLSLKKKDQYVNVLLICQSNTTDTFTSS